MLAIPCTSKQQEEEDNSSTTSIICVVTSPANGITKSITTEDDEVFIKNEW